METLYRQKLGENVRIARERAGISQRDFCLMAGISKPVLIGIEKGARNIRLSTLIRVAEGLGCEPWELLK